MNSRLSGIILCLLLLALLTGQIACLASQSNHQPEESMIQKGMAFPTWDSEEYGTSSSDESLRVLAQTTCTEWVQLVPTWYQNDKFSNEIFPDFDGHTATMESLRHAIRTSHDLGLKVMLKPHVDSFSGDWRGTFQPEDPAAWFKSYTEMMKDYTRLAQDESVEIFSVGCEFVGLTSSKYTTDWKTVIREVRDIYSGPLVYAANWGPEAKQVEFWDDLDFIGIDAYYELTHITDPTLDDLLAAWAPFIAQIESIHQTWQKPVLLTEIGYRSIDGANMRPWDWETSGEIDLAEQALCYKAVIQTFDDKDWFRGIYWWNWGPDLSMGGPADKGYTPQGKPAEEVLKRWYCGESMGKKGQVRR
jgi:hypothetical protein